MPENIGLFVASTPSGVLPSAPVRARQLLVASLDALYRARGVDAQDVAGAVGIDKATLSKFTSTKEHIQRWPNADHWDALADYFSVEPYVLLRPDVALSGRDDRRPADTGGAQTLDSAHTAQLRAASPSSSEGGSSLVKHPDSELLAALLAYWDDISPEARLELVGHGMRLRKAAPPAATVGFMRG